MVTRAGLLDTLLKPITTSGEVRRHPLALRLFSAAHGAHGAQQAHRGGRL